MYTKSSILYESGGAWRVGLHAGTAVARSEDELRAIILDLNEALAKFYFKGCWWCAHEPGRMVSVRHQVELSGRLDCSEYLCPSWHDADEVE